MSKEKRVESVVSAMGALLQLIVSWVKLIQDLGAEVGAVTYWLARPAGQAALAAMAKVAVAGYKAAVTAAVTQVSAPTPIERTRILGQNKIQVNLDAPPILPFADAIPELPRPGELRQTGWVTLEKRGDELYLDDRKVILHLSERQQNGQTIRGHELRYELTGAPVLHPNILDVLMEHPELFPESWKKDELGRPRFVYFWALIFRDAGGNLYVRYCYFDGSRCIANYDNLDYHWSDGNPAARLES